MQFSLIFFGMLFPIVPAIAVEVLDTSEIQFGLMWGVQSIGAVSSAILLASRDGFRRNGVAMAIAASIYSTGFVLFGLTHTYWLALVFLFGIGLAFPLWIAAQMTLRQNFTAVEYRVRVMAAFRIAIQSMSNSWLLGGWLIDVIGIFPTVVVAVGSGWIVLGTALIAPKDLRSS